MEIELYETQSGECPIKEYLDSLEKKIRAKTYRNIDLLEKNGQYLEMPYSRYICDGIRELRTIQGNNIIRIFYFFVIGNKAVLTNGFTKKTDKTPTKYIELAKRYREDYKRRNLLWNIAIIKNKL